MTGVCHVLVEGRDVRYDGQAPHRTIETGGNEMSNEDLQAELERLRAENAALKSRSAKGISLKVSEKGGVSVYGLGRFPVTLYKEQWTRLLDMSDDIRSFIAAHEPELKAKEERAKG